MNHMLDDIQFADRYGPWALIAGGSKSIGKGFAELLATKGVYLVLVARSDVPAAQLYGLELPGRSGKR